MGGLNPTQVQFWLEWAGSRLVALPSPKLYPETFRVSWPDYSLEKFQVLDFRANVRLIALAPSSAEIPIMDEILTLPAVDPDERRRRVMQLRLLVNPITGRYIHSWIEVSRIMKTSRYIAKSWHAKGLDVVAKRAPRAKVCRIAAFMESATPRSS